MAEANAAILKKRLMKKKTHRILIFKKPPAPDAATQAELVKRYSEVMSVLRNVVIWAPDGQATEVMFNIFSSLVAEEFYLQGMATGALLVTIDEELVVTRFGAEAVAKIGKKLASIFAVALADLPDDGAVPAAWLAEGLQPADLVGGNERDTILLPMHSFVEAVTVLSGKLPEGSTLTPVVCFDSRIRSATMRDKVIFAVLEVQGQSRASSPT